MKCNRIECYYEIKLDVDLAMGTPEKGEFQNSIKFVQVEALFSLILTKMDCLFFDRSIFQDIVSMDTVIMKIMVSITTTSFVG